MLGTLFRMSAPSPMKCSTMSAAPCAVSPGPSEGNGGRDRERPAARRTAPTGYEKLHTPRSLPMTNRRTFLRETTAAAAALAFPLVAGAQPKPLKVGILHPVTGA